MAKVLVFIHSLDVGGAERVSVQFSSWLSDVGHEVVVLTSARSRIDFFQVKSTVCRVQEPKWFLNLGLFQGFLFPFKILWFHQWLRRQKFDLAIGMTTLPAIKLLLATTGIALPVVASERIYPPSIRLPFIWRVLRHITYPRADVHLVQTNEIASWLKEKYLARKVVTLPNSIQLPLTVCEPILHPSSFLDPNDKVILAVGTKPYQKGFDILVEAYRLLIPRRAGWKLVILGLPKDAWPPAWQLPSNAADSPIFPGHVGNVGDWYNRADIFALSSRYEGIPNVLLEAMASGCACVAIDCPTGPSDLIVDHQNGLLLSPESHALDLSRALEALIDNPSLRLDLSINAEKVQNQFSNRMIRDRFLEALSPWINP